MSGMKAIVNFHAYPFWRNQSTARRRASSTGMTFHPSSCSALADEANIFLRPMRTASKDAAGDQLVHNSGCECKDVGHADSWRGQAGDNRELVEDLFQRQILAAKDVALAAAALLQSSDVAQGALAHVNEIEPGIDVGRKFLLQEIDDDAAGGSGLDVTLADRSCGIDDDHVLSSAGSLNR